MNEDVICKVCKYITYSKNKERRVMCECDWKLKEQEDRFPLLKGKIKRLSHYDVDNDNDSELVGENDARFMFAEHKDFYSKEDVLNNCVDKKLLLKIIDIVDNEVCYCEDENNHVCKLSNQGIIPTNSNNWADKIKEKLLLNIK